MRSFTITNEDKKWLIKRHNAKFRGAFLSETSGPNNKPIVWVIFGGQKIPHVCENLTFQQIRRLLNQ